MDKNERTGNERTGYEKRANFNFCSYLCLILYSEYTYIWGCFSADAIIEERVKCRPSASPWNICGIDSVVWFQRVCYQRLRNPGSYGKIELWHPQSLASSCWYDVMLNSMIIMFSSCMYMPIRDTHSMLRMFI